MRRGRQSFEGEMNARVAFDKSTRIDRMQVGELLLVSRVGQHQIVLGCLGGEYVEGIVVPRQKSNRESRHRDAGMRIDRRNKNFIMTRLT